MRMENTRTWQLPGKADHLSVPVISITKILTFRLLEDSINKFRISKSDGNSIRCKDIVSCTWKCGNTCQFVPLPTPGSMSHPFHSNHSQRFQLSYWKFSWPTSLIKFIELDDGKIYRPPLYLMVKTMVSCRFSLKPIHWKIQVPKKMLIQVIAIARVLAQQILEERWDVYQPISKVEENLRRSEGPGWARRLLGTGWCEMMVDSMEPQL